MIIRLSRRHNSTLRKLGIFNSAITTLVFKSVAIEVVLCQLRNAHVTEIDASDKLFDDDDATRIGEALRCVMIIPCMCLFVCITCAW